MPALVAPALQPLCQIAWVCECRSHAYKNTSIFAPHFTFALRMTTASSQNIGKFYQTVKLSTERESFMSTCAFCNVMYRIMGNF